MGRLTKNQYKLDISKAQMKKLGFRYDRSIDAYTYTFTVHIYKGISLIYCKLGIDDETKDVWFNVYDANDILYAAYYNDEYGKNSIVDNIEKVISKELNKLGVKRVD